MFLSKLFRQYRQKRKLGEIIQFFADCEAWEHEPEFFLEEAKHLLKHNIPELPKDDVTDALKKGLEDEIKSLSR
ncbi:MAG: hypothetical protein KC415_05600 [Anaerolineales bacterium]|nr:hypothetical protein [Anaerolineales bacterium]